MRGLLSEFVGDRGEESASGADGAFPGVHQQEAAGAVSVLGFAGFEAGLTHQRSLLVAQNSGNRGSLRSAVFHRSINFAARADPRQHRFGNAKHVQQLSIPAERIEVHELSAAGVGGVGDVQSAIGAAS